MKCPYVVNCIISTQSTFEYDEAGQHSVSTSVQQQKPIMCDCLKEECTAWKDSECHYN